jgi:Tol biopolymer transport system component
VTFQGSYNATASVSYDGKKIAMAQGSGNSYRIAMMDSSWAPRWSTLSTGSLDESPSFAPNASMVLYAAREGSRRAVCRCPPMPGCGSVWCWPTAMCANRHGDRTAPSVKC